MQAAQFYLPSTEGALRQGEIITDLGQLIPEPGSLFTEDGPKVRIQKHPFAVVISQDCDLEQDYRSRLETEPSGTKADKLVPSVLFCQAVEAATLMTSVNDSQIWKRVRQNKDERYQYLREVDSTLDALEIGVPALGLDFKRYFTLTTEDVYSQVRENAKRRAYLASRYMEHLSTRYYYFQSRVALDEDHFKR